MKIRHFEQREKSYSIIRLIKHSVMGISPCGRNDEKQSCRPSREGGNLLKSLLFFFLRKSRNIFKNNGDCRLRGNDVETKFPYFVLFFLFTIVFFACKKIVTLGLKNAPAQVVIEGEVTNSAGRYTVSISRSTGFYADNIFPPVSGASVKISDNNGVTDSLTETAPGVYSTHTLQGVPGNTYSLSVWIGDTNYTAVSTMPPLVPLDSISFLQNIGIKKQEGLTAVANFQDPLGVENYYQFELYKNRIKYTQDQTVFVFSDRLSDGRYISYPLRTGDSTDYINFGDTVTIRMYCIDKNIYNYFYELEQSSSPMTASPANPQSNISNGALGYFSAHTIQSKTAITPAVIN